MDKDRAAWLYREAPSAGIGQNDAIALARAARVLHTWAEHECNGTIQRDEPSGLPYWYSAETGRRIGRTADRETGAIKRATEIAARYGLVIEVQGDPRGAPILLLTAEGRELRPSY
jgi:hypothetical protein